MGDTEEHFRELNLKPTATPDQIHRAYRELCGVWDPQRFAHSPRLERMAEARLDEIKKAYHALQQRGTERLGLPGNVEPPPPPAAIPAQPSDLFDEGRMYLEEPPAVPATPIQKARPLYVVLGIVVVVILLAGVEIYLRWARVEVPAPPSAPAMAASDLLPTATPVPERALPSRTEYQNPLERGGAGRLMIVNQSGQDAVARLSTQAAPRKPLRLVFVKSGIETVVANIGTGVYYVSFAIGGSRSFGTLHGPFQFIRIDSVRGVESDQYKITLKRSEQ